MIHYLDNSTKTIKRARHVYFDDFASATPYDKLSPGGHLLRNELAPPNPSPIFPSDKNNNNSIPPIPASQNNVHFLEERDDDSGIFTIKLPLPNPPPQILPKIDEHLLNLHIRKDPDPFQNNKLHTYQVDLSTHRTYPFGLFISYDQHYGLPFVKEIPSTSPWYQNLPAKFRRNIWLLAINNIEPITPSAAYDSIEYNIKKKSFVLAIILSKWEYTTRTAIETIRTQFDQLQHNTLAPHFSKPSDNTKFQPTITPSASFAIVSATKPTAPAHFGEFHKNDHNIEWKKSLYEAYTKNAKVGVFTAPFPIEDVPRNATILSSKVAFKVKQLDGDDTWDLDSRHCANGSVQTQGIDYNSSYAAIVTIDFIRLCLAFGASRNMHIFLIDVGNAYQTNMLTTGKRVYIRCPPYYTGWFHENYPNHKLPPAKT